MTCADCRRSIEAPGLRRLFSAIGAEMKAYAHALKTLYARVVSTRKMSDENQVAAVVLGCRSADRGQAAANGHQDFLNANIATE